MGIPCVLQSCNFNAQIPPFLKYSWRYLSKNVKIERKSFSVFMNYFTERIFNKAHIEATLVKGELGHVRAILDKGLTQHLILKLLLYTEPLFGHPMASHLLYGFV